MKSLSDTKEWKKLMDKIAYARKDPEFMKSIKEFIRYHTGKTS